MVIIINGHPNSGKTTLRDNLDERLNQNGFEAVDFDGSLLASFNKYQPKTVNQFRQVKNGVIQNIIKYCDNKDIIIDVLLKNLELAAMVASLEGLGQDVICVRLYCDNNTRQIRDANRNAANPDAPVGFNDALNPEPNSQFYILEIDTSKFTPDEIVEIVIQKL